MKRHTLLLLSLLIVSLLFRAEATSPSSGWQPDMLGDGYEMRQVKQPDDYAGPVISTIIRKLCPQLHDGAVTHRGVLYVHGFNDYFFQKEMGDRFVEHGYDFYAVDLRRYGRSIVRGEKDFDIRDLGGYFPDIDSALVVMQRQGLTEIVLIGHSTGGLISAYYESRCHPSVIKALILNSPFLDWNLGWKERMIPAVCFIGKLFPNFKISQGKSHAYARVCSNGITESGTIGQTGNLSSHLRSRQAGSGLLQKLRKVCATATLTSVCLYSCCIPQRVSAVRNGSLNTTVATECSTSMTSKNTDGS